MADILNLNKARKRKAKAEATQQAAQNRILHGRTPAQKARDAEQAAESARKLALLKRESLDGDAPENQSDT